MRWPSARSSCAAWCQASRASRPRVFDAAALGERVSSWAHFLAWFSGAEAGPVADVGGRWSLQSTCARRGGEARPPDDSPEELYSLLLFLHVAAGGPASCRRMRAMRPHRRGRRASKKPRCSPTLDVSLRRLRTDSLLFIVAQAAFNPPPFRRGCGNWKDQAYRSLGPSHQALAKHGQRV